MSTPALSSSSAIRARGPTGSAQLFRQLADGVATNLRGAALGLLFRVSEIKGLPCLECFSALMPATSCGIGDKLAFRCTSSCSGLGSRTLGRPPAGRCPWKSADDLALRIVSLHACSTSALRP